MEIINLGENNSLLNQCISELRDINIQKDSARFRRNLERCGEIFAYEISKKLAYQTKEIQTPLGIAPMNVLKEQPVVATILRAGLPLHQGFLNTFDRAESAFITAYRKHHKDGSFTIQFDHISSPSTENKIVILCDPMLASGASMVQSYKAMMEQGEAAHTHAVAIISSKEGVDYMKKHLNLKNITLWVGAIDPELTAKSYIAPGLGDAGDLAFGSKL